MLNQLPKVIPIRKIHRCVRQRMWLRSMLTPRTQSDSENSDAEIIDDTPQRRHEVPMPQAGPSAGPLQPPPSSTRSFVDLNENSLLDWATRKVNDRTPMNDMELLGLKAFVENVNERTYLARPPISLYS